MTKMVVLAKAVAGQAEALARWYDERHIPDLLAVPGVAAAQRHTIAPIKAPDGAPHWDYLLIYEFEGDPMAVLRAMGERQGTEQMQWTDTLESISTLSLLATPTGRG